MKARISKRRTTSAAPGGATLKLLSLNKEEKTKTQKKAEVRLKKDVGERERLERGRNGRDGRRCGLSSWG